MLKVKGNQILDKDGKVTPLRGYCIGNWLMLENFMMGFPGVEQQFRSMMEKYGGKEKKEYFFETLLENYIKEEDIEFIGNMGSNAVRIAVNYRHFEKEEGSFSYGEEGFRHLDRVVSLCKKHGIYVILDLHACPGYQNKDWHSDNYSGEKLLYKDETAQQRMTSLWQHIAGHYKDEEAIAGYDIMNEPVAVGQEEISALNKIYGQSVKAIREVDKKHIIFIKGNLWGQTFEGFDEPMDDNLVYSCHFYADPGLYQMKYPDPDNYKGLLEEQMDTRDSFMRKYNVPCWIGEFGLYLGNAVYTEDKNRVLKDQLEIFNQRGHSWTMWSYKDIGNMGTLYPNTETPWKTFIGRHIDLKAKYNCDFSGIKGEKWKLLQLLEANYKEDFGDCLTEIGEEIGDKLTRTFSTYLAEKFSKELGSFSLGELYELARSFEFNHCEVRMDWKHIVMQYLK